MRSMLRTVGWSGGVGLALLLTSACGGPAPGGDGGNGVTCGPGTLLMDGACVAVADGGTPNLSCGPLTHVEGTECVPDPPSLASEFGIYTAETFDSTGPDVLPDTTDHTYVYVNTGKSFGATAEKNGVHIFDHDAIQDCIASGAGCPAGNVFLPIVSRELDTPIPSGGTVTNWSSHSLGMSPDGQSVYVPFLVPYSRYSFVDYTANFPMPATWFYKLNARTLLPDKRIECGGPTHHLNIVNETSMMTECYSKAGVYFWDPAADDEVTKVFEWGRFEGYPYLAFESPPLSFIDAANPPKYLAVTVESHKNSALDVNGETFHVPGYVAFINMETMKEEAAVYTGPFAIWVTFNAAGTMAWTSSADDSKVWRIALSLNAMTGKLRATLEAEIDVGPGPYGIALSPDETKLFVNDKAEGVRAGAMSVHGSTITVIDTDAASPTYDTVLYTIGLATDAALEPHRPDHAYLAPDDNLWTCSNANQSCRVLDPAVTPSTGGVMTTCTRIVTAETFPACFGAGDCPLGLACDATGRCGGTNVIQETLPCMESPTLATLRMPDAGEVAGWTTGRGDPHALVWVYYDATGAARVIQDFNRH